MTWHMCPGLDLYCPDPAQPHTTGKELGYLNDDLYDLPVRLDDVDHDRSDLSVRGTR